MTRIAHISDLHFGAEDPTIVAALLTELNAEPPDLVAISGDLTMGARRVEFRAACAFMQAVRAPILAVPGNHDISPYRLWQRFTDPYRRWRDFVSSETEPTWSNGHVAVVGLNTAQRMHWHWDWSRGRITPLRLRRLLDRLEAVRPDAVRIIVAHHPLLPPDNAPATPVAGGAAVALRALSESGVSLVLAGHLHRRYARFASSSAAGLLVLQGATATSNRLRGEPNAYNRISIGPDGKIACEVRVWSDTGWKTLVEAAPIAAAGTSAVLVR